MNVRESRLRINFFLRGQRSETYVDGRPHCFHSTHRTGGGQQKTDLRAPEKRMLSKNTMLACTSSDETQLLQINF